MVMMVVVVHETYVGGSNIFAVVVNVIVSYLYTTSLGDLEFASNDDI